jgi:hypothetical protein
MNCENDGTEATVQVGAQRAAHGPGSQARPSVRLVEHPGESVGPLGGLRGPVDGPTAAVPHGGSTLSGGSASVLASPGALGGQPGGPRADRVLKAVAGFLTGKAASPGRAKRRGGRGGRGCRGVKTALTAPDSAPLFKGPAFSASGAGCSSPVGTTQGREGVRC